MYYTLRISPSQFNATVFDSHSIYFDHRQKKGADNRFANLHFRREFDSVYKFPAAPEFPNHPGGPRRFERRGQDLAMTRKIVLRERGLSSRPLWFQHLVATSFYPPIPYSTFEGRWGLGLITGCQVAAWRTPPPRNSTTGGVTPRRALVGRPSAAAPSPSSTSTVKQARRVT